MAKLSTAARVARDLGLAACFGGQLFGKLALNPKLDTLGSKGERGKLLNAAWNRYNAVNAASLGIAAVIWFFGRAGISGRAIGEDARNLVLAKEALFVASALTELTSIISGLRLTRQASEGTTPIQTGRQRGQ